MHEAGMRYHWWFADGGDKDSAACRDLSRGLGVHPLIGLLLLRRGHDQVEEAKAFLNPKLTDLHDPADLPGIGRAVERLHRAVREGQRIVIYGDYDVDGITASAILWHVLRHVGGDVHNYLPHRLEEGYGLNNDAVAQLARNNDVIVSVDCGITAVEQARVVKDAGAELIITDHHELPPGELPDAYAIVHPHLADGDLGQPYPFAYLCGAGVAFKLAWQFAKVFYASERVPKSCRDLLMDLLSLVALGTVADVVPLVGENRVITTFGLGQIKHTRFVGLNAMIDATGLQEKKVDAFHVGFVLAPRLNACGRMGHAGRALHLLTGAAEDETADLAAFLHDENQRRRETERHIFKQAQQMLIDGGYDDDENRGIVLCHPDWHAGVLGIVASRLVETYARPVILLSQSNGEAHGSARSVERVQLHKAISHCGHLLNSFGGHAMAAGLRLDADKVDQFRVAFTEYVNGLLAAQDLVASIEVDACCTLEDMTLELIEQILRLAPFGRGNASPLLCLRGASLDSSAQRVGSDSSHLRLTLRQGRRIVNAIGFGLGHLADDLVAGMQLDVLFEPKLSTWQGRLRGEYHIKDLKMARN